ncbi:MAG: Sir2 family NAD-dependent protein deacetylase [Candidatus Auribacterota bacterium]|nr:Sir2 family NAD-dependent protein deacetylase [Candidatus Auribacterota bacterium]
MMPDQKLIEEFQKYLDQSRRIVFLSGAGISTESGIPDFRSPDGIYSNPDNINIFDISAFLTDPAPFYRFSAKFLEFMENALPNPAHQAIARLQETHRVTVVTQNIDDLHQRAGSRTVWCVHGNLEFSLCIKCGHRIATRELYPTIRKGEVPYHSCGGVYKPEVTFFGEALPQTDWLNSQSAIEEADLLCIVGSSLAVYPAAMLPGCRSRNCRLVIVNREPTPLDPEADLIIHGDAGEILNF